MMFDVRAIVSKDNKPFSAVLLGFLNLLYLVVLWGGSLFNIILFSLPAITGFWVFTSLSFMFKIKEQNDPIQSFKRNVEDTHKLIKEKLNVSYLTTIFIYFIMFLILVYIRITEIDIHYLQSSGSGLFLQQFTNPYIPSAGELLLIFLIVILSLPFPYYFCKWIGMKYIKNNRTMDRSKFSDYEPRSIIPFLLITIALFAFFYYLNELYIDAKINPSKLTGLEFFFPYVYIVLILQVLFLVVAMVFLRKNTKKFLG